MKSFLDSVFNGELAGYEQIQNEERKEKESIIEEIKKRK